MGLIYTSLSAVFAAYRVWRFFVYTAREKRLLWDYFWWRLGTWLSRVFFFVVLLHYGGVFTLSLRLRMISGGVAAIFFFFFFFYRSLLS